MFRFLHKVWRETPINRLKSYNQIDNHNNPINHINIDNHNNVINPINIKDNTNHFTANSPIIKLVNFDSINTMEQLHDYIHNYNGCEFKKTSNNTVISSGPLNAKLMIIGEAPGQQEDLLGIPFVGESGELLNKMLSAINIKREDCYITNPIYWRPPNNKKPSNQDIDNCVHMLYKQIEILKPKVILLLGAVSLYSLFSDQYKITAIRGNWLKYKDIEVIATFHPAYILRMPKQKKLVFADLLKLQNFYENL